MFFFSCSLSGLNAMRDVLELLTDMLQAVNSTDPSVSSSIKLTTPL